MTRTSPYNLQQVAQEKLIRNFGRSRTRSSAPRSSSISSAIADVGRRRKYGAHRPRAVHPTQIAAEDVAKAVGRGRPWSAPMNGIGGDLRATKNSASTNSSDWVLGCTPGIGRGCHRRPPRALLRRGDGRADAGAGWRSQSRRDPLRGMARSIRAPAHARLTCRDHDGGRGVHHIRPTRYRDGTSGRFLPKGAVSPWRTTARSGARISARRPS